MSDLMLCPHCGSAAEYVSEHAKGRRWAVACTMTSKVAADEGKPMCRCRTPFVRDKGQARDIWNRRAADTRVADLESQCEKLQIVADCVDERNRRFFEVESERDELQAVLDERDTHIAELVELAHGAWSMALCAMQGMPIPATWGERVESGLRGHGIDVDDERAAFDEDEDEW